MSQYTNNTVTLTTYSIHDTDIENLDIERVFTIPTDYARNVISQLFQMTLEEFLDVYTWDNTEIIPSMARHDGVLLSDSEEKYSLEDEIRSLFN